MSKRPVWIAISVFMGLCAMSATVFVLADGPNYMARVEYVAQHRQRHDAFMSRSEIPTAKHANALPELDPAKPALWIHVEPRGLYVHTSALVTYLHATQPDAIEPGLFATEFTLSFPEGGWRLDPESEDGPFHEPLMRFIRKSVYGVLPSPMSPSDLALYLVVDARTSLETLSLVLANLDQVRATPARFVLRNPHVPERLHLLRHDGRRCCASPNAPDLVLPATADHFCARLDATIDRSHRSSPRKFLPSGREGIGACRKSLAFV